MTDQHGKSNTRLMASLLLLLGQVEPSLVIICFLGRHDLQGLRCSDILLDGRAIQLGR